MKVLFLHHSTGGNLIKEGHVRALLRKKDPTIEFWDHSYNLFLPRLYQITSKIIPHHTGLTDENGELTGEDYQIHLTNTDPDGFAKLFSQAIENPPKNALSKIVKNFDCIAFKSCFPVTYIESDEKLERYQASYLTIRRRIDALGEKLFILFTPPPLRKELTKPEYANRARRFAEWLISKEFLWNRKNIRVFDFFNLLADQKAVDNLNMLKRRYCRWIIIDSHPNKTANEECGKLFVDFLIDSTQPFKK